MPASNTYNNPSIREDLLDVITNLSPQETQFFSGLKKSVAKSTLHEWQVDSYDTVTNTSTDKKTVEGADYGAGDVTNPVRTQNHTQIIMQDWKVTGTEQAVSHAGMKNPKDYHQAKSMVHWKHKAEWSLLHGVETAGSATVAREMGGVFDLVNTNAISALNAGVPTALTETLLGDYLQVGWENGGNIDAGYVGARLKRKISGFTAGATKSVESKDKRLVAAVDVYESDFGIVKLFMHRFLDSVVSAANSYNLLLLTESTWKLAPLQGREPKNYDAPKGGDYEKGSIVGEITLECLYEKANVAVKGLAV